MVRAAVLLADGFEEVEAITSIDFLRRADVQVTIVGVTGASVTGGHGIVIETDTTIDSYNDMPEAIVIPGGAGGAENISASGQSIDLIRKVAGSGGLVASICASPGVVLAQNGLLDGKTATCYPGFEKYFSNTRFSSDRVVVDGKLITSRGPGTAAEFAEAVISYLLGEEAAKTIHDATLQP